MVTYSVRPLDGRHRTDYRREHSNFKASYSASEDLLMRELGMLGARLAVVQLDVRESDLRLDGTLRANAAPDGPTVVVSFETRDLGPLRYECGRFWRWQDNLRAIALGLEALRKVERYGIGGRGEQYRGWQALPPATAMGAPLSRAEALVILSDLADLPVDFVTADLSRAYRLAAKLHHPDHGGDPAIFATLQRAWSTLEAG